MVKPGKKVKEKGSVLNTDLKSRPIRTYRKPLAVQASGIGTRLPLGYSS